MIYFLQQILSILSKEKEKEKEERQSGAEHGKQVPELIVLASHGAG